MSTTEGTFADGAAAFGGRPPRPRPRPIDRVVEPLRGLAASSAFGAILLLLSALVALAWASSPFGDSYRALLHMDLSLSLGGYELRKSLAHWISDGLMGLFFFGVGLEIKRELLVGELSSLRRASLPAIAALGGMVAPAAIYAALTTGPATEGWGIPMATDIAFALGVLALAGGERVPRSVKVLLTGLAIADDIGAVLVIALFYTEQIALGSLAAGGLSLLLALSCNRLGVRSPTVYLLLGMCAWLAFLQSGVHATLAALLMAFAIPARTRFTGEQLVAQIEAQLARLRALGPPPGYGLNQDRQQEVLDAMTRALSRASAPLQRLEYALGPVIAFLVLPVFALANAGLDLGALSIEAFTDPITRAVAAGLLLGKPIGVFGASYLAVRSGLAELPQGCTFRHVAGVAALAGVGFTMSLFIADLAFGAGPALEAARLGVLASSLLAGIAGYLLIRRRTPRPG